MQGAGEKACGSSELSAQFCWELKTVSFLIKTRVFVKGVRSPMFSLFAERFVVILQRAGWAAEGENSL